MSDIGTPPLSVTNNGNARAVRVLQELLVSKGAAIRIDGRFAIGTQRALGQFQTDNKLEPTGIADEATWKALRGKAPAKKKAPPKKAPSKKARAKKAPAKKAPAKKASGKAKK